MPLSFQTPALVKLLSSLPPLHILWAFSVKTSWKYFYICAHTTWFRNRITDWFCVLRRFPSHFCAPYPWLPPDSFGRVGRLQYLTKDKGTENVGVLLLFVLKKGQHPQDQLHLKIYILDNVLKLWPNKAGHSVTLQRIQK